MIRNFILMATSGLLLFSKEFVNSIAQPRLVGSLLTALLEFSQQTTGMSVSYIELTNVALTMITDETTKVFCALFYDREDGPAFGHLLCKEILRAFIEQYAADLNHVGRNLKDFHGFNNKIADVIRASIKPILTKLQKQRGILKVLFINEDGAVTSSAAAIDQLAVLANLQALTGVCTDAMTFVDDDCKHIMLDSAANTRVLIWKLQERSQLVVVVTKAVSVDKYRSVLREALHTFERVCILMANLHLVAR
mmetsp:Transcript_361/g.356  ORF Transcript_361/g.356 Transcript_361/m.356 type:complete len:251 (+) Transcript_361:128-880(+)